MTRLLDPTRLLGCLAGAFLLTLPGCGGPDPAPLAFPTLEVHVVDRRVEPPRRVLPWPTNPPPDYRTAEQAAWRLLPLLAEASDGSPARLEVLRLVDGERSTYMVDPFRDDDHAVWVLRSNRKGQTVLDQVDPNDPFPARHGRGGNRGRSGTSIRGVTGLRLILDATPPSRSGEDMEELELVVDGEHRPLALETLAEIETLAVMGDSGKAPRDAWSLRTLAAHIAGKTARVTAIRGEGDREIILDAEAWRDPSRTPVIRLNRRGKFKFHWADADHRPAEGEQLRNVSTLVISTR